MTYELTCTCGGTTSVVVSDGDLTAVAECACGKVLFWSAAPTTLNLAVLDSVDLDESLS